MRSARPRRTARPRAPGPASARRPVRAGSPYRLSSPPITPRASRMFAVAMASAARVRSVSIRAMRANPAASRSASASATSTAAPTSTKATQPSRLSRARRLVTKSQAATDSTKLNSAPNTQSRDPRQGRAARRAQARRGHGQVEVGHRRDRGGRLGQRIVLALDQQGFQGRVAHSRSPIRNSAARSSRICGGPSPGGRATRAGAKAIT